MKCVCVRACVRACVRVCDFRKTRTNYNPSVFGNHYFSDSAPTLIALLPPYFKKKIQYSHNPLTLTEILRLHEFLNTSWSVMGISLMPVIFRFINKHDSK